MIRYIMKVWQETVLKTVDGSRMWSLYNGRKL